VFKKCVLKQFRHVVELMHYEHPFGHYEHAKMPLFFVLKYPLVHYIQTVEL
jgi:hypothetical protein